MDQILGDLNFVFVYLDDILISSGTKEENRTHLFASELEFFSCCHHWHPRDQAFSQAHSGHPELSHPADKCQNLLLSWPSQLLSRLYSLGSLRKWNKKQLLTAQGKDISGCRQACGESEFLLSRGKGRWWGAKTDGPSHFSWGEPQSLALKNIKSVQWFRF